MDGHLTLDQSPLCPVACCEDRNRLKTLDSQDHCNCDSSHHHDNGDCHHCSIVTDCIIFGNTVHRSTDWYKNAHMHHLGPCFSVMYSILYSFFPNLNMHHSNNSAAVVTSPPKMSKSTNVHNSDLYMYCGIFPCSYILYRYDALGDVVMQFPIATIMTATKKYVFDCSLGTITRSKVPNQWEEIHNCLE